MWVFGTNDLAKAFRRERLIPFVEANKAVLNATVDRKHLLINGFPVYTVGASSPNQLASVSCATVILDEEAKFAIGRGSEAHPSYLARERIKSFGSEGVVYHASTPGEPGTPFSVGCSQSAGHEFLVPCPHCGDFFPLDFSRAGLVWEGTDSQTIKASARIKCPKCEGLMTQPEKIRAMQSGVWQRTTADALSACYSLSTLYSAFTPIGDCAWEFYQCTQSSNPERLHNFANSWQGRVWQGTAAAADARQIRACIRWGWHRGHHPPAEEELYAAFDPGLTETHWVIGSCGHKSLRIIDFGICLGLDSIPPTITQLQTRYPRLLLTTIDAGNWAAATYQTALRASRTVASRGRDARGGVTAQRDATSGAWVVGYSDSEFKTLLYSDLLPSKRVILPAESTDALLNGLEGQKLVSINGRQKWKKIPNDHFGDCCKLILVLNALRQSERQRKEAVHG